MNININKKITCITAYILLLHGVCFSQITQLIDTNHAKKFQIIQELKNGEIVGELQDQYGYPVAGMLVMVELAKDKKDTNKIDYLDLGTITTLSGENGVFRITSLKAGNYNIFLDGGSYESKDTGSIKVFSGTSTNIFIKLRSNLLPEDRIFSATQSTLPINFVPNSVSVLPQKHFNEYGFATFKEGLQSLSAVAFNQNKIDVRNTGGSGYHPANSIITMIDGIPFYSADNLNSNISAIPTLAISKTEVLKNPASGLYGNSASSGAVNYITDIPTKNSFELKTNYQTYALSKNVHSSVVGLDKGLQGIDAAFKKNGEKYDLLFAGSWLKDYGLREKNVLQYSSGLAKAIYKPNSHTSMRFLGLLGIKNEQEFITWKNYDSMNYNKYYQASTNNNYSNISYMFNTDFETLPSEGFRYGVSAGISGDTYFQTELDSAISYSRTAYIASKFHSLLTQFIYLNYGLNLSTSTTRNQMLFNEKIRYTGEFFTGFNFFNNEDIVGNISARFEIINTPSRLPETDLQISPNIGIAYQALDETFIRASISRGYRAPTMLESFGSGVINKYIPLRIEPNPKLMTQGFWHGELGFRHFTNIENIILKLDGALFLDELFAFISPDYSLLQDTLLCKYSNISRGRSLGAELIGAMIYDDFELQAKVSSVSAVELKYARSFPAKHDIIAHVGLSYSLAKTFFSVNYSLLTKSQIVEKLYELISSDLHKRTGISQIDVHANISLSDVLGMESSLNLSLKNILDTLFIADNGAVIQVRSLLAGLRVVL